MKKIGGFFEFELETGQSVFHDDAIKLSTGRACLNYLIHVYKPSKIYIPYYCCDALYEPMEINSVEYEFYKINNQLEISNHPQLEANEFIIYCDFFGVKSDYAKRLIAIYKNKLIFDNSHSFFHKGYKANASFTTARKYFGVPDGAFLYLNKDNHLKKELKRNVNVSINHNVHSLLGLQDLAFSEFSEYEKVLDSKIENISIISEKLLSNVDFAKVKTIRNRNFNFFRKEFNEINTIEINDNEEDCFCYPLLLENPINISKLHSNKIFIPSYWKDTIVRENKDLYEFECKLSNELLPLPIDHRYSLKDLKRVTALIKKLQKKNG